MTQQFTHVIIYTVLVLYCTYINHSNATEKKDLQKRERNLSPSRQIQYVTQHLTVFTKKYIMHVFYCSYFVFV